MELAIRPLREEVSSCRVRLEPVVGFEPAQVISVDVGLGGFFGPCSAVRRTSSPSSMVASIMACHASFADCCVAYEDKEVACRSVL